MTPGLASSPMVPDDRLRAPISMRAMALHLLVLFNFAVTQPVFDLLSVRFPYLRDLNIPAAVIYGFVFGLTLGLPALLILGVLSARLGGLRLFVWVQTTAVFGLLVLLALPALKQAAFLMSILVYLGSLLLAAGGTWCYWKSPKLRSFLMLCACGVPLFPTLFLMRYSTSTVVTYAVTQRTPRWTPAPVVMIVFDEFCGASLMTPEREIDATRFPNFAALARDSQWFRNASSVNEQTTQAVPAILSGRYAENEWHVDYSARQQNLFSMLVGSGEYDLAAFEPVTRLAPEEFFANRSSNDLLTVRLPSFLNTLMRVYLHHLTPIEHLRCLPKVPHLWFGVRMEADINSEATRGTFRYSWSVHRQRQFDHFLRTIDGSATPTVHFLHILLPHVPWSYLPSGRRYTVDSDDWELQNLGTEGDRWSGDELQVLHAQQRYLLQLMYADRLLGEVMDKMRAVGMYDRSLLVVTADHGISFRPGEHRRAAQPGNLDEILSVPLLIKRPDETHPGAVDRFVESVDIFPTMAEVLGYRLTQPVDGWSVFDSQRPPRKSAQYGFRKQLETAPLTMMDRTRIPMDIRRQFGPGEDPMALYRAGPLPELLGRKVASLRQNLGPALTIEVSRFDDDWPTDSEAAVPCFFEGRVRNHDPVLDDPVVLAIAVNGVIHAVTRTYRHAAGLSYWEALVAENAFQAGHNDIQVVQIQETGPDWAITPCVVVPLLEDR